MANESQKATRAQSAKKEVEATQPVSSIAQGLAFLHEAEQFKLDISRFESVTAVQMIIGFPEAGTRRNKPVLNLAFYNEQGQLNNLNGRLFTISPTLTNCQWPAHAETKLENGTPVFNARVSWGRLSQSALQKKADDLNRQRELLNMPQDAKASDFDPLVITEIRFLTNAPLAGLENWKRFGPMYSRENNMNRNSAAQTVPVSNTRVVQPASYARMSPYQALMGGSAAEQGGVVNPTAVPSAGVVVDSSMEDFNVFTA